MDLPMPLSNIKIIDLTINWAGPTATQYLADMGAEVIKVESIQRIDDQRGIKRPGKGLLRYPDKEPGERPWDRSSHFNQLNRNKLGITLDLTRPRGKELFLKLVRIGDAVVDSFSAGVMEKLDLGYPVLKGVKSDIIVMSMPGFGKTGPYRDYRGWGPQWESVSGLTAATGYPDLAPIPPGTSDPVAGLMGAFALLTALNYRDQTGIGQFIDLSQAEVSAVLAAETILDYTINQRGPQRLGNRHPFMAPHGVYRCKGEDMWVAIAISSDEEWQAFCKALGHPAWTAEARFSSARSRWDNQDELDRLINEWTREQTNYEVMNILQTAGVAAGSVQDLKNIFDDTHLQARGMFETVTHREAGTHSYPGAFWKMSKTPSHIRLPAPCLGEHNTYILGELLRLSSQEIAELEKENIIGTEPLE